MGVARRIASRIIPPILMDGINIVIPPKRGRKKNQVTIPDDLVDREFYRTPMHPTGQFFTPWAGYGDFAATYAAIKPKSLVSPDRVWTLQRLAIQSLNLQGEFWECGVYKGGTAAMLAKITAKAGRSLRLFDTFEGMPETDQSNDYHAKGDFADTSLEGVQSFVGTDAHISYHQGFIPDTFADLEQTTIAFAHVDVDIYKSVWDCMEFIYPRLCVGGVMIFDDYGVPSCPGARKAIDLFFADKPEEVLIQHSGQAMIFKLP